MNKATPILNQMQSLISRSVFEKLVKKYNADNNVRTFPTWSLLKVMLFAQCTGKKSLRDICKFRSKVSTDSGLKFPAFRR